MKTVNEKQVEKAKKLLDAETVNELGAMSQSELEQVIVQAQQAMSQATSERDNNPHYQSAKLAIKDLSQGLREVNKRQNSKIVMALHLLEEKGQA